MIKVTLKDGVIREFEAGTPAAEVAKSLGMGLYKAATSVRIDGELADLRTPLEQDCRLDILTFEDKEGRHAFWHTGLFRLQAGRGRVPRIRRVAAQRGVDRAAASGPAGLLR